jgi:hypothetical protein
MSRSVFWPAGPYGIHIILSYFRINDIRSLFNDAIAIS